MIVVPAKSVSSMLPSVLMLSRRSISFCKIRSSALATFCSFVVEEWGKRGRQVGRNGGWWEWGEGRRVEGSEGGIERTGSSWWKE